MTQYRVEHNKNYTVINNTIVTDSRLSWKAKGIWLYAFSRPDNWSFYKADILKQSKDSDTAVDSGLKELENFGYLIRIRKRDERGRVGPCEWTFFETPKSQEELEKMGFITKFEPKPDFPDQVNPEQENVPLTNTDSLPSTEEQQTTGASPPKPPSLPAAVVVVPFSEDKKKLLEPFGFSSDIIDEFSQKYDLERLKDSIQAYHEYAEKNAISSELGTLRTAIEKGWKPNKTQIPEIEDSKEKEKTILCQNLAFSGKLVEKFQETEFLCAISGQYLWMGENGKKVQVDLTDPNAQNIINQYLKLKGKI